MIQEMWEAKHRDERIVAGGRGQFQSGTDMMDEPKPGEQQRWGGEWEPRHGDEARREQA